MICIGQYYCLTKKLMLSLEYFLKEITKELENGNKFLIAEETPRRIY